MIRSKKAMGIFWAWLMLALHLVPGAVAPAHAQGTRKDDIVFNSRGIPLAGASVRVCAQPATGQPCTPLANIYSDPLLSEALANPTVTDGMGNYFFYAAPGTYEVEISGPQISTKQIPDVILPANPASPVFSGTISAFSLNLAGNLSVTGNTTVIGNFASGTINLSNQSTPPGAAGTGTVNLYTKSADKRLYYKDETGTEVGPLGSASGAQTNVANTFTAPQSIAADFHTKGPNPFADIGLFGAYYGSSTPPTISCNITGGQNTITCSGGVSDFAVSHGVSIPGAGPTPTVLTPSAPIAVSSMSIASNVATIFTVGSVSYTNGSSIIAAGMTDATLNGTYTNVQMVGYNEFVATFSHANCNTSPVCSFGPGTFTIAAPGVVTPLGQTGGSTTYNYKAVAVDYHRGLSAASAPFTTTVGAAALGLTSYTIAANGCVTSGGQTVITTTAAHNIPSTGLGVEINILGGSTGSSPLEGALVAVATTSTTVTVNTQSLPAGTYCPSGGTLQVLAQNQVQWLSQPGATTGYVIYRCIGPLGSACSTNSAYSRIGFAAGTDSFFIDWGLTASGLGPPDAAYIPSTPPTAPINGILATTITNISGTTVTLAANAGASVTAATVLHDDAEAILAACNFFGGGGAEIYSPGQGSAIVNSLLDEHACSASGPRLTLASTLVVNEPIIPKSGANFSGSPMGTTGTGSPFQTTFQATVTGKSFPIFLMSFEATGAGLNAVQFNNLTLGTTTTYQNAIYFDQDTAGNNPTTTTFNNVSISGPGGSTPIRLAGGFGLYVNGGFWGNNGGVTAWGFPPPVLDVTNQGLGMNSQQLGGIWEFTDTNFDGGEFLITGSSCGSVPGHMMFTRLLMESGYYPLLAIETGSSCTLNGVNFIDPMYADEIGGQGTAVIQLGASNVGALKVTGGAANNCGNGNQPLFAASSAVYGQVESIGCSYLGLANFVSHGPTGTSHLNTNITLSGNAQLGSAMAPPASGPAVSISGASGPPANTYFYSVAAVDVNGKSTAVSASSAGITVNGSQGVLLTFSAFVPGQVSTNVCRGTTNNPLLNHVCASSASGFHTQGLTFLDNGGFFPTTPANQENIGASSSTLGPNGLATGELQIPGGGFDDVITGNFTATRAQLMPDVSGVLVGTGYINSAYDNATRANGAIGANWAVGQNSINISGNAFVGGTGGAHNVQYWSANTFSNYGQFAEVTVVTLNGTSDFIGPMVMASGNTGYTCIEDSTSIFIQKYSGGTGTNLTSASITAAAGDVLRLEVVEPGGALTCYRNGVSVLTANDASFTSGAPGLDMFNNVAASKNWTGGNLHPLNQLDIEADYTKVQHLNAGVGIGAETFTASPRGEQDVFLPGALTSTWTASTWTTDKAVTVTRVQVQAKTAPSACSTNAIVRLTDGTSPVNVTLAAAANDSGSITQNYAAGATITISVQTAAAGCTTSPADANVVVQYRMQ